MIKENQPSTIQTVQRDQVLIITLNRPELHNALNPAMIQALTAAFQGLQNRDDVRVVILTGNGRSFCAGADISSMRAAADMDQEQNQTSAKAIFDLMQSIDECPKPVIGRINGAAIGGGMGLVSCCDITIAAERARFGFSEVLLGLVPAVIAPFVLSKIGEGNGRAVFLTGKRFDAVYAREMGLIQQIASEEELDQKVNEQVQQLLQAAPGAQAAAKELIRTISQRPKSDCRDYTSRLIAKRRASAEGREGMSAFLEKREPEWRVRSKE